MRRLNHAGDASGGAITPRWATGRERVGRRRRSGSSAPSSSTRSSCALWNALAEPVFTPQWWFYWCDAWIFVGSIVATYAMARGWNEFWLAWIAVDLVGVPLRLRDRLRPTAVMYTFYGVFVIYGFIQWVRSPAPSARGAWPIPLSRRSPERLVLASTGRSHQIVVAFSPAGAGPAEEAAPPGRPPMLFQ